MVESLAEPHVLYVLAVGPQRTASSWLDQALRSHQKIVLPEHVKETFFFDQKYERGLDWYLKHFEPNGQEQLLAEVCSTYFESTKALERIQAHNPEARIITTVRNPVARTFSSFGHEYAKGRASGGFFQAVKEQPRIIESGRYSVLGPKWETAFARRQIFYLVQEDIEANPQEQMDAICRFLGVDSVELPEELMGRYGKGTIPRFRWLAAVASRSASALRAAGLHRVVEAGKQLGLKRVYSGGNPAKLSMTREVFDYLLEEHELDIAWLESKLGRNFRHWRDPATYGLQK